MSWRSALAAAVPADAVRPRVFIQVGLRPPLAAGPALAELVEAAGGTPFLVRPGFEGDGGLELSWEELMEFDPQLVLYAVAGQGLAVDPAELLAIEGWDRTEAARQGRVFSVADGPFQAEGEGLAEAGALLQALLAEGFWGGARVESPLLRRLKRIDK